MSLLPAGFLASFRTHAYILFTYLLSSYPLSSSMSHGDDIPLCDHTPPCSCSHSQVMRLAPDSESIISMQPEDSPDPSSVAGPSNSTDNLPPAPANGATNGHTSTSGQFTPIDSEDPALFDSGHLPNGNGFGPLATSLATPIGDEAMASSSSISSFSLVTNGNGHGHGVNHLLHSVARVHPPGTAMYKGSSIQRDEYVRLVLQSLRDVGYLCVIYHLLARLFSSGYRTLISSLMSDVVDKLLLFLRQNPVMYSSQIWLLNSVSPFYRGIGTLWNRCWRTWACMGTINYGCVCVPSRDLSLSVLDLPC